MMFVAMRGEACQRDGCEIRVEDVERSSSPMHTRRRDREEHARPREQSFTRNGDRLRDESPPLASLDRVEGCPGCFTSACAAARAVSAGGEPDRGSRGDTVGEARTTPRSERAPDSADSASRPQRLAKAGPVTRRFRCVSSSMSERLRASRRSTPRHESARGAEISGCRSSAPRPGKPPSDDSRSRSPPGDGTSR